MWHPRPASRLDPAQDREQTAARRLELLAADLGVTAPRPEEPPPGERVVEGNWWADHTRIAHRPEPAEPTAPPPGAEAAEGTEHEAPALPVTGRHADRRRWPLPPLPEVGPAQVAVLAILIAVGLAGTTWWLLRDRAEPVAPPPAAAESAAPLVEGTTAVAAESDTVTVDVAGKVRRPGIVVLDRGARVVDALEAAGGARKGVDTTGVNLARVLVDGEQILVGVSGGAPPPATGADGTGALVNLNLADQATLETLPNVGPVTAAAIIAWRDEHGGFGSVDQLIEVDGIGEKTLGQIAPHVTV